MFGADSDFVMEGNYPIAEGDGAKGDHGVWTGHHALFGVPLDARYGYVADWTAPLDLRGTLMRFVRTQSAFQTNNRAVPLIHEA